VTNEEWEIVLELLETWKQQKKEHIEALDALLKTLGSRDSMSQAKREKFEAKIDALKLDEERQFNAAMAKAKTRGLVLH
jgi:hypothetical protein